MKLCRIDSFALFRSCINSKFDSFQCWKPDLRFFGNHLQSIVTSNVLKLGCSETAQMKDFSKLFKTIMNFFSLSFLVTEQSLVKKSSPVF